MSEKNIIPFRKPVFFDLIDANDVICMCIHAISGKKRTISFVTEIIIFAMKKGNLLIRSFHVIIISNKK